MIRAINHLSSRRLHTRSADVQRGLVQTRDCRDGLIASHAKSIIMVA
jgi:hypothetical protein